MENKLLMTKTQTHIISASMEDGKVTGLQLHPLEQDSVLGNIYIGKVKNIVKNINSAFVEFSKGRVGYLPLEKKQVPIRVNGDRADDRILIGDEIFVQVIRDAVKTKPPSLSCQLDFSGKYLVIGTGKKGISVSKKIKEKEERERLYQLLLPFASDAYEIIARTNSKGIEKEVLFEEFSCLKERYEKLMQYGKHKSAGSCLFREAPAHLEQLKNLYRSQITTIETDDFALYREVKHYLEENRWMDGFTLSLWEEDGKFTVFYPIDRTIQRALKKKVWLKSGGYLVIEPTEALVSVDVNTGKAVTKKKDVQAHFLKLNKEAAVEIALQLRLRNLSGMILVDFIDLKEKEMQEELLRCFKEELEKDVVPTKLIDMTKLGLVEVTRKRVRKPLHEVFFENSEKYGYEEEASF